MHLKTVIFSCFICPSIIYGNIIVSNDTIPKTITETLTVNLGDALAKNEILITETVFTTVTPTYIVTPVQISEDDRSVSQSSFSGTQYFNQQVYPDGEDDQQPFDFDFEYFSRKYGKISDASGKVGEPIAQEPGIIGNDESFYEDEGILDFQRLNEGSNKDSYSFDQSQYPDEAANDSIHSKDTKDAQLDPIFDSVPSESAQGNHHQFEKHIDFKENEHGKLFDHDELKGNTKISKGKKIIENGETQRNLTTTDSKPLFTQITVKNETSQESKYFNKSRSPFGASRSEISESSKSPLNVFMMTITFAILIIYTLF